MGIKGFISRQLGRTRYSVLAFAFLLTIVNTINTFLNMLSNMDIIIKWYWIVILYISSIMLTPIVSYILEKLGVFQIDVLQRWKMSEEKLFKEKMLYQATMISIQSKKNMEELLKTKETIENGWK
jgi:hypothetical protein